MTILRRLFLSKTQATEIQGLIDHVANSALRMTLWYEVIQTTHGEPALCEGFGSAHGPSLGVWQIWVCCISSCFGLAEVLFQQAVKKLPVQQAGR